MLLTTIRSAFLVSGRAMMRSSLGIKSTSDLLIIVLPLVISLNEPLVPVSVGCSPWDIQCSMHPLTTAL